MGMSDTLIRVEYVNVMNKIALSIALGKNICYICTERGKKDAA